ncbi:phosphoribosylglycinamide formyltransferase [Roseisolibacter sp. H3M3-2]|uniref:phosphoribosylglycinamide formyltransferase n=1 Tax=Roseisolibacter sp. H3M3-2 TaxID=3031323 RepID=UPI0023DBFA94|nr:phosphoribosylglycinamide formyltransferase [Roseisolibacter sp. H3M3-2]MDF1502792.1 phosphoribosylglycinamide formyltransferase [Roseisolibacter sp. H3M3-2]
MARARVTAGGAPPRPRARVAVLASGGGSNLQALLDHLDALGEARAADVVLVLADRPQAGALARAAARGIATAALADPADGPALAAPLGARGADLVVLAGYLKLVPAAVTARHRGRMLNVHPALLPAFGGHGMYGARVHRAVLAAGARVSGPTVHFVDEAYDRGAIVAQWPVPVSADDTPETLAARVLRAEHALLPRVVQAVAAGAVALEADGRVLGAFALPPDAPPFALPAAWAPADAGLDAALTP